MELENLRQFQNGILIREIKDGMEITDNLGKRGATQNLIQVQTRTFIKDTKPVPYSDWPLWAKAVSRFAKSEDKGIGDVVARTIGAENSEAFKRWFKATTGKDCGCTGRHRRLNIEYPL